MPAAWRYGRDGKEVNLEPLFRTVIPCKEVNLEPLFPNRYSLEPLFGTVIQPGTVIHKLKNIWALRIRR